MKQLSFSITVAAISLFFTTSCQKMFKANGPTITKNFDIKDFETIDLAMDAEIIYAYDSVYTLEVKAQQDMLDIMIIEKQGDELDIRLKNWINVLQHAPITIIIHSPKFEGAKVSGSGTIRVNDYFQSQNIAIHITGSGKIIVNDIDAVSADISISGSGDLDINNGTIPTVHTDISGSGDMTLSNLEAKDVDTHTSGSGTTRVWATSSLNVSISGSGKVYYKGNPSIETHITGSGKIVKL